MKMPNKLFFIHPCFKVVENLSEAKKKKNQEEVQPATAVLQEEEIVWSQLLLGSVHAMGQVGTV